MAKFATSGHVDEGEGVSELNEQSSGAEDNDSDAEDRGARPLVKASE